MSLVLPKGSYALKLQITIDGKAYKVDVEILEEEERAAPPGYVQHPLGYATSSVNMNSVGGSWDASGKCHSPVTGLVLKVNVKPGQTVAAGELIVVLEAMKMETNVTAPHQGTVKEVHVAPGDSVKMNQVLVECECTFLDWGCTNDGWKG
jgi:methylmalonyl-CoA carboxyltransferase 1.3S subunit